MTTIPAQSIPAQSGPAERPAATTTRDQTFGILSLVVAIVSVVTGFVPIGSIVAIVLGALAMQREPASRKLATAGVLIGAIPIALGVGFAIMVPFGFLTAFGVGALGF